MKYAIVAGEGRTENKMQLSSVHRTLELAKRQLGTGHGRIIETGDSAKKGDIEFDDWLRSGGKDRVKVSQ